MSSVTNNIVQKLLQNIAERENLQNYTITETKGSTKGDGYMGNITSIEMKSTGNSDKETINLIVKTALKSEALRKEVPIKEAYQREIYMYTTVIPTFQNLVAEKGLSLFSTFVNCYETSSVENNECLILQDIKQDGFRMWKRKIPLDKLHVEIVMKTLGRYHALSFAFRHYNSKQFSDLIKPIQAFDVQYKFYYEKKNFSLFQNEYLNKVTQALCPVKDAVALAAYSKFNSEAESVTKYLFKPANQYSVILHGDCWINNMMFAYDDLKNPDTPTRINLFDLQLSRVGAPVIDIIFFFYSSSSKDVLDNYKHYLDIYYNSLSTYLIDLGCNPDELYPYAVFLQEWKDYVKYGLFTAIFIVRLMLVEEDEVMNFVEAAESKNGLKASFANSAIKNNKEYTERIRNIILHFAENNLL